MRWPWEQSNTRSQARLALLDAGELNLHALPVGGCTASCLEQQMLATQCWLLSVSPLHHSLCFKSHCSAGPSGAALHQAGDRLCSHGHADLGCAYRIYAIKALEHQPICFNAHFYSLSNISFQSRPSAKAVWKHLSIVLEFHG